MKISVIEKLKGRKYKSEDIIRTLFNLELSHDEEGAPKVDGKYISISDTKNYWACAFSDVPIGLDIEEAGRSIMPSVSKRLHKDEREYLAPLSEGGSEWKDEFLTIWVKKEAYMKLLGTGLKAGLSSFSVIDTELAESFRYKKLYVGISGEKEYAVESVNYDAPFEKNCMESAADILDRGIISAMDLKKKLLAKGYPEKDIEEAISKMAEYGYVNDSHYAQALAKKLADEGKATRRIEFELAKKGINKETAKDAASEYKESAGEAARKIAEKMLKGIDLKALEREEKEKKLAKIARKLASLGYESSLIYDILDRLKS